MADSAVENAALKLIRATPGWASCRALELGCGDGRLLETLIKSGCDARGTTYRQHSDDYIREREYPESLAGRVDHGIDLNRPLPYADASFDLVYSTEVLEHIESHRTFVTEAGRVLRIGGRLVLTTPNLHRLHSRLQFALTGLHGLKRRYIPPATPIARMEEFHCHAADFHILHYLLHRAGLKVRTLGSSTTKLGSLSLLGVLPISWLYTRQLALRKIKDDADREVRLDLARWMMSPQLMLSEHIVMLCEKVREGDRLDPAAAPAGASASQVHITKHTRSPIAACGAA